MEIAGIISLVALATLALLAWFLADLDYDRRWSREEAELDAKGRWKERNELFEAALRCRRPMLRLFRAIVLPGSLEIRYALHLSNQGEHERGLQWADRALRRAGLRRTKLGRLLVVRAHILCRMGRYEEAKKSAARARSASARPASVDLVEGIIELSLGHIRAALELGQRAVKDQQANDAARALVSGALVLQGRFQEAVNMMAFQPSNALVFFAAQELEQVTRDELGRRLVLAMDEAYAAVIRPARHLGIALACLEAGDTENLIQALDRAERELKSHPGIEHIYRRLRACGCALKADLAGTEDSLTRARALANEVPSRSAKYETQQAAGRAYLLLGRSEAALVELRTALQLVLHPVERHSTNYWLARSAEAAEQREEAVRGFRLVASDGFDTWMSADAQARLAAAGSAARP